MDATENWTGATVPVRLVAVSQAGADPAAQIPPEGLRTQAPDGGSIDAIAFAADETDRDFNKYVVAPLGGGSGQTFIGVSEPDPCPDEFEGADADGD